ncbi:MAG: HDIG domain-containing protein [Proteobacteria bacterium]|nr:HDIG domain-containing protein [Pseudomonadota bacterium]
MITRDEAFALLQEKVQEPQQISHAIEAEAVMRGLAAKLGRDVELWGITGLLHDLDYATTKDDMTRHGLDSAEVLQGKLPQEAVEAIKRHNEMNGNQPKAELDFALRCGETVTGLIHTNALVRPTRMEGMNPKSLKKKMKDKAFAAAVNRDTIRECEKIGLDLGEFFQLSIDAITSVADQVGLAS